MVSSSAKEILLLLILNRSGEFRLYGIIWVFLSLRFGCTKVKFLLEPTVAVDVLSLLYRETTTLFYFSKVFYSFVVTVSCLIRWAG